MATTFEFTNDGFIIRGADIPHRTKNFSGLEKRNPQTGRVINSAGERTFCLELPDELAEALIEDGWRVKEHYRDKDSDEPIRYYIPVKIGFKVRPPMIWLVTDKRGKKVRTLLSEERIEDLDKTPSEYIKVSIRGQHKEDPNTGEKYIKAWLAALQYHAVCMDPFADDDDFIFEDEMDEPDYDEDM